MCACTVYKYIILIYDRYTMTFFTINGIKTALKYLKRCKKKLEEVGNLKRSQILFELVYICNKYFESAWVFKAYIHELDKSLEITNLDEYKLINLPMEHHDDLSQEHTGVGAGTL